MIKNLRTRSTPSISRIFWTLLTMVLMIPLSPKTAFALSGQQQNTYRSGIYEYDVSACGDSSSSSGGSSGPVSPGQKVLGPNIKTSFGFLTSGSPNYSAAQGAGLVGNFMQESYDSNMKDINPTAQNPSGAYGIAQWLGTRLVSLRAWTAAEGKQYSSLSGQLDFVKHELKTTEAIANADLLKQDTASDAAYSVYKYYEGPNDGTDPEREANAVEVFNNLSGQADSGGDSTGGSTCSGSGGGTVDCSAPQGTAKILCEAEPYNGIYYRWGGGHQGYEAFIAGCPDPSNPPDPPGNHPHGSPGDPTDGGLSGNPSPCATDCSGLVSIAVDAAFNKRFMWSVASLESDMANWKAIPMSSIQPGDVLTQGSEHVEIVDKYSGGGTVTTFGSHRTGTRTGSEESGLSIWSGAYRYVGPQ